MAGVLAIALLGNLMVHAFGSKLENLIASLGLPSAAMSEIQAGIIKLGDLSPPAGLNTATTATIRANIAQAFIFGFRLVMAICGGLAIASAAIALTLIPSNNANRPNGRGDTVRGTPRSTAA